MKRVGLRNYESTRGRRDLKTIKNQPLKTPTAEISPLAKGGVGAQEIGAGDKKDNRQTRFVGDTDQHINDATRILHRRED